MADFTTNFNTLQFDAPAVVVGSETVYVAWRYSDGTILLAYGATVPTDATAGYCKGAMFLDTDATSSGSVFWVNEGTAASCDFNSVTVPDAVAMTGDVTGDSDENTVAKINGVALGTTTATSGNVLTANGTNWATATPDAAGLVAKAGNQTIAGTKTFSSTIVGSVNGNAGTVTNGLYTTDRGEKVVGLAHGVYDFSVQNGTAGAKDLGATIPDNAILTKAWYEVLTPPTSEGSATIGIGLPTDGATCIQAVTAYNDAKYEAGIKDGVAVGTAATMVKTTAARALTLNIADADLTAGLIHVFAEYVQSA
jgi:hypothetical protein